MDALAERAVAAYLGLALGDALGATVEFMTPGEIAAQYGVHDRIRGGGWLRLKPGQVTDDTGMNLALGEAILTAGGVEALAVARAFDRWMRAKPVDIGNTVRRGIVHFRLHGEPTVPPDAHGAGNGAAMRVLPAALATLGRAEAEVRAACRLQARVTHHHPLSDAACECLGLMLQDALRGADRRQLLARRAAALVTAHPAFAFAGPPRVNPSGYVVETLQAVFQALARTDDFRGCLVDVVNRGGDADTTGAICGMLAGAVHGLEGLPEDWLRALDPAVQDACRNQALALLALARSARGHSAPTVVTLP
ncbi:MAG: ADP-ribosyl-[dinitrogen reductase] hydrolase [Burkholderiales bacterium]|nr:ADP-ribosyl-[dinitrogen reductase] hydrolase [Burkholderiales bacterium]